VDIEIGSTASGCRFEGYRDPNPRSLERGTTLFEIAPFDHSGNSDPATEIISARPEVVPIWGVRHRGK
jgi:hypothetical protein